MDFFLVLFNGYAETTNSCLQPHEEKNKERKIIYVNVTSKKGILYDMREIIFYLKLKHKVIYSIRCVGNPVRAEATTGRDSYIRW